MSVVDLDKLVGEIANEGKKSEGVLAELRKGMSDGFTNLAALLKGMGKPDDKPAGDDKGGDKDDDDDKEPDGDEDKGGKGDGDGDEGQPGYKTMEKGKEGEPEFIDVTELVVNMSERMKSLEKADKDRAGQIAKLVEQNAMLLEGNRQLGEAFAVGLQPLYKGVMGLSEAMGRTSDANATLAANRVAASEGIRAAIAAQANTSGVDKSMISNALRKGVIDDNAVRLFNKSGRFDADDTKNAEITKAVQTAATSPAA